MSGNEMQSHLGVAIAAMELAKRRLLHCFDLTHPHMIDEIERRKWVADLNLALLSVQESEREIKSAMKAPMLQSRAS